MTDTAENDRHGKRNAERDKKKNEAERRKRKRRKKAKLCFEFAKSGTCAFGDDCGFAHDRSELGNGRRSEGITAIKELVSKRTRERRRIGLCRPNKHIGFRNAGFRELFGDVVSRYFERLFHALRDRREDQYVNVHKNMMCTIGIAPGHPILAEKKNVESVEFRYGELNISGKKKKGAPRLQEDTTFCTLRCKDGTTWKIRGCIPGSLWEINQRIVDNPSLIITRPETDGYIGMVHPRASNVVELRTRLLSEIEYECLRESRKEIRKETPQS